MASNTLELLRSNLELSEKYELAIGEELDIKPSGQKAKVWQQHVLNQLGNKIVHLNQEVTKHQFDQEGLLADEINRLKNDPLNSFYSSLQGTLEYYTKFPNIPVDAPSVSSLLMEIENEVQVGFSGEEVFGKYLDLHEHFLKFTNLFKSSSTNSTTTSTIEQDYLQYLDRFYMFFYIKDDMKHNKQYGEYIHSLWNYLIDFYHRLNPLVNLDPTLKEWEAEFEKKVEAGEIKRVEVREVQNPQPLRLGMFNDQKELEALGMDRLKEGLVALGLKCGGSLQERAARLWSVRGKSPDEIPKKLKAENHNNNSNKSSSQMVNEVLLLEFKITSLCEMIGDIVRATRRHAEKQQARSVEEKEQEIFEEEYGLLPANEENGGKNVDDDDEDAPIYNPLNLPLGWDGKPIPYWLYKLHGLGVEYKCEVCGNQSYWGRRAFDRHFQEWKHSYGMRCLGVPNTKHFHDITSIDDVLTLYHKIKDHLRQEQFVAELDEEFEDTQGNILNRRTYEDLARQGLL
eukprot:gene8877-9614_t